MKQYQIKQIHVKDAKPLRTDRLYWRVEAVYHRLKRLYGAKGLILRASKVDAVDLLGSEELPDRVIGLQRILRGNPAIGELSGRDLEPAVAELEGLLIECLARRQAEEELQQLIQAKMNQKYNEYIRDIKLEIAREQKNTTENAQTLKRLGYLTKMEHNRLRRSALEVLRPANLSEVIGQEKAIKSLLAKLSSPYPQHILFYGPPGVGKTTCARLALEIIKNRPGSVFSPEAPFIEVDGTTLRWDPREATNPLLGSVHDPIYQGARKELAEEGIPEPKLGLVSEAHGGILFIDEIGDMDPYLQNKLLKVMEDKRVFFESSYYDPHDQRIPRYIKQMFEQGVPADFILIGATTRPREDISPAFRSRCMEVYFEPLSAEHIREIVHLSAHKLNINIAAGVEDIIADFTSEGRGANKILVEAFAMALNEQHGRSEKIQVETRHVFAAVQNSRLTPCLISKASPEKEVGRLFAVGAYGYQGALIELEAVVFPAETPGKGSIRFNDTAGSMTRDSVFNAASVLRQQFGENLAHYDLHINVVGGGRVDGPSAGAAIYLAILSALKGWPARQDVAITGELSLQGRVKPVGALYEKIYGARRAGIKKLLVPAGNLADIPADSAGLQIIPIQSVDEAWPHFFPAVC